MSDVFRAIAVDVGIFIGTNVDDLTVLTVLFLTTRTGGPKPWQIVAGQYLGVGALVLLSLLAAFGLVVVPDEWVGLLGLIPLGLGAYGLAQVLRDGGDEDKPPALVNGVLPITGLTLANGADNVAVYTPLFRTSSSLELLLTSTVFAVLIAVWCAAGAFLGNHRRVIALVERSGPWLVPIVFITIGVIILLSSGVIAHILNG